MADLTNHPSTWDAAETAEWLKTIGPMDLADIFEEHQRRGALWILPLLLHEDPALIMSEEKNDSVETHVAVGMTTNSTDSAIVRLFLQGVNVVRDTQMDVVDAVMAVYYAYQTDYPAIDKKTLTFIERGLLHLRDSNPLSSALTLKKCLERFAEQP